MVGEVVGVEALDKKELWRILQRNERRGDSFRKRRKSLMCSVRLFCVA
jgi:hypothetical protein